MRTRIKLMTIGGLLILLSLSLALSADHYQENLIEDIKIGDLTVGKSIKLQSKILELEAHLLVFLPSGYEKTEARFPVVFSFRHYQFTYGILSWNYPEMILVDFSNVNYELFSLYPEDGTSGIGDAGKMRLFLKSELFPFIDNQFRTLPFRILTGGSSGGIFSIYAMLSEPELINTAIAAGPMFAEFDWGRISFILEDTLKKRRPYENKLYFTAGDQPELLPYLRSFQELLDKYKPQGLTWKYDPSPGETHLTIGVRTFFDGLKWVFKDYTLLPDSILAEGRDAVQAHVQALEKTYGGFSTERITTLILTQTINHKRMQKRYKDAVAAANLYIEIFPESPFAFYHLAQTLEEMGENEAAKLNYEQAITKAKKNMPGFEDFIQKKLNNLLKK